MRVTYQGINSQNEKLYFWIYRIGKINYDITSTIILSQLVEKNKSDEIAVNSALYLAQQMYVHFNEAVKVFKEFEKDMGLEYFISENFRKQTEYAFIIKEFDFKNLDSNNNMFIKKLRDNSVHYNNSNIESFKKVISQMTEDGIVEVDEKFPENFNIELKAQIIHLISNTINNGVGMDEFAYKMLDISNSLMKLSDDLVSNMIIEITKTIEDGKAI